MITARSVMRRRLHQAKIKPLQSDYIQCKKGKRECRIATDVCRSCKKAVKCKSYQEYQEHLKAKGLE